MAPDGRLRVAVDATSLLTPLTGVGVVTSALLGGLAERPDVDVTAFSVSVRGRGLLADRVPAGVRAVAPPLPARLLRAFWQRAEIPRIDLLLGRPDVVHGPNFVVPPSRAGRVATVHDLTPMRFPELTDRATQAYPDLVQRAVRAGAWIHTPSRAVRAEVVDRLGVPPDRVRAIPNGVEPVDGDPDAGRALAGSDRYVLAIGTVEPRKDLPTLLAAFDHVAAADPDVALVHAGPDGWGQEAFDRALAAMGHRARVRRLGYVADGQRADLLAGASVFAYPSRYEGFGLPPLEAMTAGTPVVASLDPAIAEVCAGHARLVPVGDVDALGAALSGVLAAPPNPDALAAAAAHARSFTWERSVGELVGLYQDAAAAR